MKYCKACGVEIISLISTYYSKLGMILKCENPDCILYPTHDLDRKIK